MKAALAALGALALGASSATAQEATTWTRQDVGDVHMAYAVFPEGLAFIARCQGGSLELLVQGLQVSRADIDGAVRFGDGRVRPVVWSRSTDGRYLIADRPAHLIRGLAQVRPARVQFGMGEGAAGFDLDPPADATAPRGVLTSCGQPLTSAKDEADPIRLNADDVIDTGRVRVSSRAQRDNMTGWALVSCVTGARNRLEECEVEAEGPAGYGFGQATLATLDEARLKEDMEPGRLVTIRFTTIVTSNIN